MFELKGLPSIKNLKAVYSTEVDNLIEDFFIPCLSNSIRYDRISGYFSSILYPMIFRGIKELVLKEKSKIRLIIGFLPKKEKEIFIKNQDELEDYIQNEDFINNLVGNFIDSDPLLKKNHLKLLAWLLLNDKIEIKLGLLVNNKGQILNDLEKLELSKGKLHKKIGIFYDEYNNSLSFCGSNNETPYGWQKNFEEFDIHYSWEGPLKGLPWLEKHKNQFDEYWENDVNGLITIKLPNKCIQKLRTFAPKEFDDVKIEDIVDFYQDIEKFDFKTALQNQNKFNEYTSYWKRDSISNDLILNQYRWKHQIEATENWVSKNYIGIFEMATGTGKTITSIKCMYHLFKEKKNLICWILVPDKFLIAQWTQTLKNLTKNINILQISDKKSRLRLKESLSIFKILKKNKKFNFLIFLSTTKMVEKIINVLNDENILSNEILLITDETHSIGSLNTRQNLKKFENEPNYKIGLTATPIRYFDPIGTDFIFDFFNNKIAYKLTLEDALKKGFLCPYEYYIEFCNLTKEENEVYDKYTKQILILDKELDEDKLIELYNLRAKIVKKANNKLKSFKTILKRLINQGEFNRGLIYCDDHSQLGEVAEVLKNLLQKYRIIDANTPSEERIDIIKLLEYKHINIILAMRCLDQGVDIPFLKIGIFLSSSGNEKEFIQRRGRLLRIHPSKKVVKIYDIIVKKNIEKGDDVFLREKERIRLFNNLSINKVDVEIDYFNELGELL